MEPINFSAGRWSAGQCIPWQGRWNFSCRNNRIWKRGIAVNVPEWLDKIVRNAASVLIPALMLWYVRSCWPKTNLKMHLKEQQVQGRIRGLQKAIIIAIQVSVLDCTGCGNCVDVCPAPEKALVNGDLSMTWERNNHLGIHGSQRWVTKTPSCKKDKKCQKQPVCPAIVWIFRCLRWLWLKLPTLKYDPAFCERMMVAKCYRLFIYFTEDQHINHLTELI